MTFFGGTVPPCRVTEWLTRYLYPQAHIISFHLLEEEKEKEKE